MRASNVGTGQLSNLETKEVSNDRCCSLNHKAANLVESGNSSHEERMLIFSMGNLDEPAELVGGSAKGHSDNQLEDLLSGENVRSSKIFGL
jgi:hypothetical protein